MAVNKRKVLDAARKYAQKGSKAKALKEYNTLLKAEPRDAKLRLELGDAHRRWGEVEEAVGHYTKVADQYTQEGFEARAVAVYKQILNLDPKRYGAYVSLSELYQRMGLDSEAINSLQTAADGYHKEGMKREALELLRRMAQLDPSNTTSRLKVAELLHQEGLDEEAVAEYDEVAAEMLRQENHDQLASVYGRILELAPKRVDVLVSLGQNCIRLRQPERAEPFVKKAVEMQPDEPEFLELLCDLYKTLERPAELAAATKSLADVYRTAGDEDKARSIMQRLPSSEQDIAPGPGLDQSEAAPILGDDELLDDDDFLADGDEPTLDEHFEIGGLDQDEELGLAPPLDDDLEVGAAPPEAGEDALPSGEPEQLLAEASVYLRYGKSDQAILSLRAVLQQEAANRSALEKLGEAYAETGQNAEAISTWIQAAECARAERDAEGLSVLRDRIATLDEDAAAGIELLEEPAAPNETPVESPAPASADTSIPAEDDFEIELDLDDDGVWDDSVDEGVEASGAADELDDAGEVDAPGTDSADELLSLELDIDLDVEDDTDGLEPDAADGLALDMNEASASELSFEIGVDAVGVDSGDAEVAQDAAAAAADDGDFEIEFDEVAGSDIDEELEVPRDLGIGGAELTQPDPGVSQAGASAQLRDELEQADFFFEQGMLDQAEQLYQRVLETAPNHPSALLRIGEIAEQRGEDPSALGLDDDTTASGDQPEAIQPAASGPDLAAEDESDCTEAVDADELPDPAGAAAEDPFAPSDEVVGIEDETAPTLAPEASSAPEPELEPQDDGELFDLAAELRDALEEAGADPGFAAAAQPATEAEAFESLFNDFKKGVSETLDDSDAETRFDLGIAYKEMGLLDDAIGEFSMCIDIPERRTPSLHMMALCALELGRGADAVAHLEQALAYDDLKEEEKSGLRFELGRALEAAGDVSRAVASYREVLELDAAHAEARERLDELERAAAEGGLATEEPEAEEAYESFDDLIAEGEASEVAAAVHANDSGEELESFGDLMSDASEMLGDAEFEEPTNESSEQVATPADPAPSAEAEAPAAEPKKKRKKKISFA